MLPCLVLMLNLEIECRVSRIGLCEDHDDCIAVHSEKKLQDEYIALLEARLPGMSERLRLVASIPLILTFHLLEWSSDRYFLQFSSFTLNI